MIDIPEAIKSRAAACGIDLHAEMIAALADHAGLVMASNERLHLTTITDPRAFIERHLGEGFEGAAMLAPDVTGELLDLGSGNGYPALPLAAARPGLRPLLTEASQGKAAFLGAVLEECGFTGRLLSRQVQRPGDLEEGQAPFRLIVTRALGGWERILPRFAQSLQDEGEMLLWAGGDVAAVARRSAWRRLRLLERKALPGRERSWIWRFGRL
jgi:16S rRNA (guanine527-N7)-methyltransferase